MANEVARVLAVSALVACLASACGSTADVDIADDANGAGDDGSSNGGSVSFDDNAGDSGQSTSKRCATDQDCGEGAVCLAETKTCSCGAERVAAEIVPAKVLVVLDRSGSMKSTVKGSGKTKWEIAVAALTDFVKKNETTMRLGLELFPIGNSCDQKIAVPISDVSNPQVASLLTASLDKKNEWNPVKSTQPITNIYLAMNAASAEPSLQEAGRRSYVILLTDGNEGGCSPEGKKANDLTTSIIQGLHAKDVDTFVLGFSSGVDAKQMNVWAEAGGQPQTGAANKFYDTVDQASLDAALQSIASSARSCSLKLASPPPGGDVGLVYVFMGKDEKPLPRDPTHANAWDYEAATQTVTLYGASCDALKRGTVADVNVVFGCPGAPPPANPVN